MKIRKNDIVKVVAGKDKGKTGKVTATLQDRNRVVVENVNMVKKHRKPTPSDPSGGIKDEAAPIHVSNVMILDSKVNQPTRVKMVTGIDGAKVRASVKSNTTLD